MNVAEQKEPFAIDVVMAAIREHVRPFPPRRRFFN
jgi:hypothetical protein